jgi:dienelactone hydrolase
MKTTIIIVIILVIASGLFAQAKVREAPYMQGETELQGKLVYDPLLKSIRSAVLIVHDMWGPDTSVYANAMKLAQLGHIVLIADLYGKDVKISSNEEATSQAESLLENKQLFIDRITAAMEFLKSQRKVDQGKIGVVGYGLGANAALELALQGTHIAALAMYYPWLKYDMDEPPDYSVIKASVLVFFGTGDPRLDDEGLVNIKSVFDQNKLDWQMVLYGGAFYGFTNKTLGFEVKDGMAFNYNADLRSFDKLRQFFTDLLK